MAPKTKKQKVSKGQQADPAAAKTLKAAPAQQIVSELLDDEKYGRLYTSELNIRLTGDDEDAIFQWLCCSILFSSGLSEGLTMRVGWFRRSPDAHIGHVYQLADHNLLL